MQGNVSGGVEAGYPCDVAIDNTKAVVIRVDFCPFENHPTSLSIGALLKKAPTVCSENQFALRVSSHLALPRVVYGFDIGPISYNRYHGMGISSPL